MKREEAEKALGIIRNVIQNTREDLVAHNWGMIWLFHSFTNLSACLAGWYVESRNLPVYWYLVPLAIAAVVNILIVLFLVRKDHGVRSYIEWQIHGIWWTFMVFTAGFALVLHFADAKPYLFGPVFAMTSGIGFAMMGVVFSRQLPYAFLFFAVMLVGPIFSADIDSASFAGILPWQGQLLPGAQWGLIGILWWCAMFLPGITMQKEKLRRAKDESKSTIL